MVQARVRIGTFTRDNFPAFISGYRVFTYINNMQNVREYTGTVSAAGNGQFNRFCAIDPKNRGRNACEDFDFSLSSGFKGMEGQGSCGGRVFQQGVLTYRAL